MSQEPVVTSDGPGGPTVPPAAAPPTGRRPLGCWGIGAITCGSLFLIFAVFLGVTLWFARPYIGQALQTAQDVAQCTQQLQAIHSALERYRRANGEMPPSLAALHPKFISRREVLHCPADERPGTPVSYQYAPEGSSPQSVIVTCDHHRLEVAGREAVYLLLLQRNGVIRQDTRTSPLPAGALDGQE